MPQGRGLRKLVSSIIAEAEAQAVAPQRRASWGSKERPAIATSTKPHVNGDVDELVWLRGLIGLYSAGNSTLMVAKIEDRGRFALHGFDAWPRSAHFCTTDRQEWMLRKQYIIRERFG